MSQTSLETLSDDDLHAAVRRLTARSNLTLADLLTHLGEVEARGIHRSRACATLDAYCRYELRMSEDAAFRRAKAARLVRQHPRLRDVIARGELHLTGLLMIAPYLGGERHDEILQRSRFRSKREIARLIAEIDPKPEVPARIEPVAPARRHRPTARALAEAFAGPVRDLSIGDRPGDWIEVEGDAATAAGGAPDGASSELEEGGAPDGASSELEGAERALAEARRARLEAPPDRPLRYHVQFTASQEYVDLLDEALDLLGFSKKAASLPEVQLRALRELVDRLRKRKRGAPERHAETSVTTAPARARAGSAPARKTEMHVGNAPARKTEMSAGSAPAQKTETSAPARAPEVRAPSRYVPVAVRRPVWERDEARCTYVDDRGVRCAETRGLEVHHAEPFARGGPPTVDNLRLMCPQHNLLLAERDFGREHMDSRRGLRDAHR